MRRGSELRSLAALMALMAAGCQFQAGGARQDAPRTQDTAPIDTAPPPIDAPMPADAPPTSFAPCADPWLDEPFTGSSTCPWQFGPFNNGGTLAEGSGRLAITVGSAGANAGCVFQTELLGSAGVTVEVPRVLTTFNAYTLLQLSTVGVQLVAQDAELILSPTSGSAYATQPYDAVAMAWWRMRPVSGAIVAEYSPDGVSWTELGSAASAVQPTTSVLVMAGNSTAAGSGTADFARFVVCK